MPERNPISQRAYARHRGCAHATVRQAIKDGRLSESIVAVDGRAKIADIELADREWEAKTKPIPKGTLAPPRPDLPDKELDMPEARLRHEIERWRLAQVRREMEQIALAERQGQVVQVDEARALVIDKFTVVKTRLLGVATRARQRLPHLSHDDVELLESLIREALEELADDEEDEDGI